MKHYLLLLTILALNLPTSALLAKDEPLLVKEYFPIVLSLEDKEAEGLVSPEPDKVLRLIHQKVDNEVEIFGREAIGALAEKKRVGPCYKPLIGYFREETEGRITHNFVMVFASFHGDLGIESMSAGGWRIAAKYLGSHFVAQTFMIGTIMEKIAEALVQEGILRIEMLPVTNKIGGMRFVFDPKNDMAPIYGQTSQALLVKSPYSLAEIVIITGEDRFVKCDWQKPDKSSHIALADSAISNEEDYLRQIALRIHSGSSVSYQEGEDEEAPQSQAIIKSPDHPSEAIVMRLAGYEVVRLFPHDQEGTLGTVGIVERNASANPKQVGFLKPDAQSVDSAEAIRLNIAPLS